MGRTACCLAEVLITVPGPYEEQLQTKALVAPPPPPTDPPRFTLLISPAHAEPLTPKT